MSNRLHKIKKLLNNKIWYAGSCIFYYYFEWYIVFLKLFYHILLFNNFIILWNLLDILSSKVLIKIYFFNYDYAESNWSLLNEFVKKFRSIWVYFPSSPKRFLKNGKRFLSIFKIKLIFFSLAKNSMLSNDFSTV